MSLDGPQKIFYGTRVSESVAEVMNAKIKAMETTPAAFLRQLIIKELNSQANKEFRRARIAEQNWISSWDD